MPVLAQPGTTWVGPIPPKAAPRGHARRASKATSTRAPGLRLGAQAVLARLEQRAPLVGHAQPQSAAGGLGHVERGGVHGATGVGGQRGHAPRAPAASRQTAAMTITTSPPDGRVSRQKWPSIPTPW